MALSAFLGCGPHVGSLSRRSREATPREADALQDAPQEFAVAFSQEIRRKRSGELLETLSSETQAASSTLEESRSGCQVVGSLDGVVKGTVLHVRQGVSEILAACRHAGISSEHDPLLQAMAGKAVYVLETDTKGGKVKCSTSPFSQLDGIWLGSAALSWSAERSAMHLLGHTCDVQRGDLELLWSRIEALEFACQKEADSRREPFHHESVELLHPRLEQLERRLGDRDEAVNGALREIQKIDDRITFTQDQLQRALHTGKMQKGSGGLEHANMFQGIEKLVDLIGSSDTTGLPKQISQLKDLDTLSLRVSTLEEGLHDLGSRHNRQAADLDSVSDVLLSLRESFVDEREAGQRHLETVLARLENLEQKARDSRQQLEWHSAELQSNRKQKSELPANRSQEASAPSATSPPRTPRVASFGEGSDGFSAPWPRLSPLSPLLDERDARPSAFRNGNRPSSRPEWAARLASPRQASPSSKSFAVAPPPPPRLGGFSPNVSKVSWTERRQGFSAKSWAAEAR
mmetsp:Transcript_27816/g.60793  ORF Transcript_27816/g.60793 Transcript_27816/m.60793 type:complete len:518 (-) Transcript_27816:148-1701(-)